MNPEKYMQNYLYLLDVLIFANNVFQSYHDDEDVCMYLFMRRFTAFTRFSKGLKSKNSKVQFNLHIRHGDMGLTEFLKLPIWYEGHILNLVLLSPSQVLSLVCCAFS